MKYIIKIVESLKHAGLLIKGVIQTIQHETKEQRGGFLGMLLGTLVASSLRNMLPSTGVTRPGKGTVRVDQGC